MLLPKNKTAVPAIDIERAIKRKRSFEANPESHTYVEEEEDAKDE